MYYQWDSNAGQQDCQTKTLPLHHTAGREGGGGAGLSSYVVGSKVYINTYIDLDEERLRPKASFMSGGGTVAWLWEKEGGNGVWGCCFVCVWVVGMGDWGVT